VDPSRCSQTIYVDPVGGAEAFEGSDPPDLVLITDGRRIYVSGDTEDIPEMRALENIDAAFVCMNLPYTMDVESAADAVLEFRPAVVYPYHYRGRPEASDVERFRELVEADPAIEVRLLRWY